MAGTMPYIYRPLMDGESIEREWCVICGQTGDLQQHHVVWRSWGECYDLLGRKRPKPTVTLCGLGNTSGCHGLAHTKRLHFRWDGEQWLFLTTDRPTRYEAALELEGWRPIHA